MIDRLRRRMRVRAPKEDGSNYVNLGEGLGTPVYILALWAKIAAKRKEGHALLMVDAHALEKAIYALSRLTEEYDKLYEHAQELRVVMRDGPVPYRFSWSNVEHSMNQEQIGQGAARPPRRRGALAGPILDGYVVDISGEELDENEDIDIVITPPPRINRNRGLSVANGSEEEEDIEDEDGIA